MSFCRSGRGRIITNSKWAKNGKMEDKEFQALSACHFLKVESKFDQRKKNFQNMTSRIKSMPSASYEIFY